MSSEPRGMRAAHRLTAPVLLRRLRVDVDGVASVPSHGAAILVSNHGTNLDNFLLASASPRPVHFLGKRELARGPWGRAITALGMVPVARGAGDAAALEDLVALLGAGRLVALFPEGTRSTTGEVGRFRSGMARIAARAAAPVVPVGLRGCEAVWPREGGPRWRRPAGGVVAVRFGTPHAPPRDDPKDRRRFTAAVRADVAALAGQPLAGSGDPGGAGWAR
ncbi:MAG: lysophospholipid acyltransferase family protein [Actinomycetota bacterium]